MPGRRTWLRAAACACFRSDAPTHVRAIASSPPFVEGLTVVRESPRPSSIWRACLDSRTASRALFIHITTGTRSLVVGVDEVIGVRRIDATSATELPPLLAAARGQSVDALTTPTNSSCSCCPPARLLPQATCGTPTRRDGEPAMTGVPLRSLSARPSDAPTGLSFDESSARSCKRCVARRLAAFDVSEARYFTELEDQAATAELLVPAEEVTIGETYFFRHLDQFRAYAEVALPERTLARAGSRPLKVLSAGSSSGEEAYSLAIVAYEQGLAGGIQIDAID